MTPEAKMSQNRLPLGIGAPLPPTGHRQRAGQNMTQPDEIQPIECHPEYLDRESLGVDNTVDSDRRIEA